MRSRVRRRRRDSPSRTPLGTGLGRIEPLGAHLRGKLAAPATLIPAQPRELARQRSGSRHRACALPVVDHRQRAQPRVHPYRVRAGRNRLGQRHSVGRDRREVAACPIAHERHRAQPPEQRLGAAQLHAPQARQLHVRPALPLAPSGKLLAALEGLDHAVIIDSPVRRLKGRTELTHRRSPGFAARTAQADGVTRIRARSAAGRVRSPATVCDARHACTA